MAEALVLTEAPTWPDPDVYFTPGYGRLDARSVGGEWYTLGRRDGAWTLPVVERRLRGVRVASSPYGYAGIHGDPALDADEWARCWRLALDRLRERGVVSLFLRFHPLDPGSRAAAERLPGLDVRRTSTTYAVTIREVEAMWAGLQGRARTEVRKAERHDMRAVLRPLRPEDVAVGSAFRSLYGATMDRVGAADRYYFGDTYFRALAELDGSDLSVVEVQTSAGVGAAAIIMRHGTTAHYHLSGSDREAARQGANSLMLWTVLRWCADQRVTTFHLGGGVSEDDGLARFKRSFGDQVLDFHTGRAVVAPAAYERLVAERAGELGVATSVLADGEFFPAFLKDV